MQHINPEMFLSWLTPVTEQALAARQRCLVVLAGESDWLHSLLTPLLAPEQGQSTQTSAQQNRGADRLIYSDDIARLMPLTAEQADNTCLVDRKNYRHHLGTENSCLLFDAGEKSDHFNIDALAALSGTLVAGGVLLLLWPGNRQACSLRHHSVFLQRFFRELNLDDRAYVIEQGKGLPVIAAQASREKPVQTSLALACKTSEQFDAVQHIIKVVKGHRNRPLVLTADRGRGKSSALAIAAAELLAAHEQAAEKIHIGITAPHLQACEVFFRQLKTSLPDAQFSSGRCLHPNGIIEFLPVDVLLQQQPKLALLLVDEAAAIPVYLLQQLLDCYHRMVFSSTVHGYEGAGRGFTLKFRKTLKQQTPQHKAFHLLQPIRWAENDPLEAFIFKACLLKAALADIAAAPLTPEKSLTGKVGDIGQCLELTPKDLLADEDLLEQVFAVLVTAHYQTKPGDLKMLLDNPQMRIFCLKSREQITAVALLMLEGKATQEEVAAVKQSQRRLRDQFIPQSLMSHNGIEQAFDYSYLRVMRIAVHPMCQQKGLGSYFLSQLQQYAQARQVDFIGSSFGANSRLLSFWLKGDYQLARLGFTPDGASGEHSALVLKALNGDSQLLLQEIHLQFYRSFDHLLLDEYRHLPVALITLILHACPQAYLPELSGFDRRTVIAFAAKQRLYSSCVYSLHLWLKAYLSRHHERALYPLISRVLCKHSIEEVCRVYGFTGKKALNKHLINLVQQALAQPDLPGD